ncbi:TonB-dependent receptor domain-containing protein [Anabaena sp. FACHB-709]|uniref:Ferric aerobactin receptor n=2 Tax=Nostocaceae TaxID=1162 RepID=A0A1Z4KFT9_ANAVA|nr:MULTISPECIES: TonB-dependent receptor [Nostocaceae]BAY67832.1 ferric aerobactin receptor [Trichormus variabilis NIES-23]HBW29582.1 TonB-dependent receptor [Nostoc sp. UBA8866]MBD2170077.1 TonB-dependent receptor [Anabaena cylindrica FACHB-318]MBD2261502.1 TonB-dependent receptor [Anabaena sp. FACHB-709]MBD2271086.1 TonB-dependent receptor [Nostoc sp. PCC 7120 = FACHB-418]
MRTGNELLSCLCLGAVLSILIAHQSARAEDQQKVTHSSIVQSNKLAQTPATGVITGVELNLTNQELEIILQTKNADKLETVNRSEGNSFIADIPNAQLNLPSGREFRQENPGSGISLVTVTNIDANTIRVTVTGETSLPKVELFDNDESLIFAVFLPDSTRTNISPTPTPPTSETPSEQPTADSDDPIELVVTATRREEDIQNVPRSVTVITREQLEQQTTVNRDLTSILGNTVPGLGASAESQQSFAQTLRGRPPLILVDGVPISSNIDNDTSVANLRRIDVGAIERIEVVRGPSAVYGDGAAGGVINIITRRPDQDRVVSNAEIGIRSVGNFKSGSFGNFVNYGISGQQGGVDFIASFTRDSFGTPFDAEGDRIPLFGDAEANSASINVLGKLGFQLGSEQRLQITANYFNDDQSNDVDYDLTVGQIPGIQKARALDQPVEFINSTNPFNRGTVIQLDYTHNNILNSQLQAQAYYRQTKTAATLFDNRIFDPDSILDIGRSVVTSERFGGRLQLDTPLSSNLNLLWGADYSSEDSKGDYDLFDVDEFDNSGRRIARKIGSSIRIAPFTIQNLGLFSQVKWEASENVSLSGGVRYENINVSVIDNWVDGQTALSYRGGEKTLDDVVFNAGVVYKATPTISLFANFAQGFSLPNISRIVQRPQPGFNFAEDVELSAPQKVDSYELGIRGQWRNFQASLAGFYSYSSLGTTVQFEDFGSDFRILRAPQRNYGIELAVDWQPSDKWKLGSTLTWSEGEREDSETGEFVAITGYEISPLKLTAYLENETLPGWNNRLQALYIGNRDRAFDAGIDPIGIDSYLVMDLISSLKLGNGTLSLGVRNLLNNQYLNVVSQINGGYDDSYAVASRGRTFTLNYRWSW